MAGGMCRPSLVPGDPGSFHLVALSSWRICSWPGSEGKEGEDAEGWVESLDVVPSRLSLNWGPGRTQPALEVVRRCGPAVCPGGREKDVTMSTTVTSIHFQLSGTIFVIWGHIRK